VRQLDLSFELPRRSPHSANNSSGNHGRGESNVLANLSQSMLSSNTLSNI
jgi:hypothetical protein